MAKKFTSVEITLLDLPSVKAGAVKNILEHKLADRIHFKEANILHDDFPCGYDCVMFNHQLVIWGSKSNQSLLRKAYRALKPGGFVSIFSSIADEDNKGSLMAALDSVYFRAVASGEGMIYSWSDYRKWLIEAGFKDLFEHRCSTWTPHGVITAFRSSHHFRQND